MSEPETHQLFNEYELRQAHEGQVFRIAGESFAVVAKHRRRRTDRFELEAEDGSHATLIGVPAARVTLREGASQKLK